MDPSLRHERYPHETTSSQSTFDSITLCDPLDVCVVDFNTRKVIKVIPRSRENKAVASLLRHGRSTKYAESGWASRDRDPDILNGETWTNRALLFAEALGVRLPPDARRDQGVPGKFYASHAEMQLIVYLISRVFSIPRYVGDVEGVREKLEARKAKLQRSGTKLAWIKANMYPSPPCFELANALMEYGVELQLQGPDPRRLMLANGEGEVDQSTSTSYGDNTLELESRFSVVIL
ncbi:hypothetical protein FRC17_009031 [Serendipita sp. 399]|nr:hypothetical protein FRC17_009031 [Serendipita sp. 399]